MSAPQRCSERDKRGPIRQTSGEEMRIPQLLELRDQRDQYMPARLIYARMLSELS